MKLQRLKMKECEVGVNLLRRKERSVCSDKISTKVPISLFASRSGGN